MSLWRLPAACTTCVALVVPDASAVRRLISDRVYWLEHCYLAQRICCQHQRKPTYTCLTIPKELFDCHDSKV